jgi:hypothetical protein
MNLRDEQAAMRARQEAAAKSGTRKPRESKLPAKKSAGAEATTNEPINA